MLRRVLNHSLTTSIVRFPFQISKRYSSSSSPLNSLSPERRVEFALNHLTSGIARITNYEIESGKGSWIYTTCGKKLLDFTCGIGVANLGHSHPKILKAIHEQIDKVVHSQTTIGFSKPMLDLIEALKPLMPPKLNRFFFVTSGSEAVEYSVKVARQFTKKKNIISFIGGHHGRTYGAMALDSAKTTYGSGFGPFIPGVFITPYAKCHSCGVQKVLKNPSNNNTEVVVKDSSHIFNSNFKCCNDPLVQLENAFKQLSAPDDTAAVIIEPVLGEGGYVVPPLEFLKGVREICTKNNVMMIVDEIQTGFGRTGKQWAFEHYGITPDILIFAKGMANGMPISGIVTKEEVLSTQLPGSMGGTYSGNVVSCASSIATIKAMKDENVFQNTNERGNQLKKGLLSLQSKFKEINDIRGLGLMIGMEFDQKLVPVGFASNLAKECAKNGLLLLNASSYEVIRFIPALNVSESEIEQGLNIFETTLTNLLRK